MTFKVLCTDNFSNEGIKEMKISPLLEVTFEKSLTHEQLLDKIPDYDALIVRSASHVARDIIEAGANLKIIARAGVGIDNIDIEAATEQGIFVVNTPESNTTSTAEHTFALLLALSRHIPQAARSMSEGHWEKKKFIGAEVANKTLGIIGMGHIGREVARRAKAFGMNVIAYDPYISDEQFEAHGVKSCTLDEIYKNSDYISIHTTLTKETANLISKREISLMKPTTRIINCARGGIINEEDLAKALKEKKIAGAALDVFSKEPYDKNSFKDLDNVILTPHLGASTIEAQEAVAIEAARAIIQFFSEGISFDAVNLKLESSLGEFKNHIILAEKLGNLLAQLNKGKLKGVKYLSSKPLPYVLALAAAKGALNILSTKHVTLVNVSMIAREDGISITKEIATNQKDFSSELGISLQTDGTTNEAWGAVLADGTPKIVMIDGYSVEIDPFGPILFIHNSDRPGVIGGASSILGEAGVNIAEMQNVRKKKGADALTIIRIDEELPPQVLEKIKKVNGVTCATVVYL